MLIALFSSKYRMSSFPPYPFLGQPSAFSAPWSPDCPSVLMGGRTGKEECANLGPIQQKEHNTDPPTPSSTLTQAQVESQEESSEK